MRRHRRRAQPQKIDLTDREMIIGDFDHPSISPEDAFDAALQARRTVLSGFRLLRVIRPDIDPYPIEVGPCRQDVVELAGRLVDAAVEFELPEMVARLTVDLRSEGLQ